MKSFLVFPLAVLAIFLCACGDTADNFEVVIIGPAGGTVIGPGNSALEIPPGALEQEVRITIKLVSESSDEFHQTGDIFEFGPAGTSFSVPVTVKLQYDPDLVLGMESGVRVWWSDSMSGSWAVLEGDPQVQQNLAIGYVDHFSFGGSGEANPSCEPTCDGKQCGPDGCDDTCPPGCDISESCDEFGQCQPDCVPACDGKQCGPDGCNDTCPPGCDIGESCDEFGQCQPDCVPDCDGKQCGSDGCDDVCLPGCDVGESCDEFGQCLPDCVPACDGKQCGPDGCDDVCPPGCDIGESCDEFGQCLPDCVPDCDGRQCGSDGCDEICGICAAEYHCNVDGICVDCVDHEHCPADQFCDDLNQCQLGCRSKEQCEFMEFCIDGTCLSGQSPDTPYCSPCTDMANWCGSRTSYCLLYPYSSDPFAMAGNDQYCAIDCEQDRLCPNGFSCNAVTVVKPSDICQAGECPDGIPCLIAGGDIGICPCHPTLNPCPGNTPIVGICDQDLGFCQTPGSMASEPCTTDDDCCLCHATNTFCESDNTCEPLECAFYDGQEYGYCVRGRVCGLEQGSHCPVP
ncbi:MAG: hypothetical protein JRJ87_22675 [Deltaproteobacteria bacterium]|nr:hypothetical protein [Deltaproteobacteria bacterium]